MPTLQFSHKHLERLLGRKMTPQQMRDAITRLGPGVETVEGDIITVEALANRPDMMSSAGLARAIASVQGIRTGLRKYSVKRAQHRVIVDKSVAGVRPFTACAIVSGLKLDDARLREVIQMQEKLHASMCRNRRKAAIGIYPLDAISWPVKFEARKPAAIKFTPLDGTREMSAQQIIASTSQGQAYGHLLEGSARYPVFVDAKGEILSMPPIINSAGVGCVTKDTTSVFIECSGFDQDTLDALLTIIVCSLADEGGAIHAVDVVYGRSVHVTPSIEPREVKFSLDYLNKRCGLSWSERDIKQLLAKMGIGYAAGKAIVPAYRVDVLHQVDLAEDCVIAYGLDALTPLRSNAATVGGEHPKRVFIDRLASLLTGLGLLELNTLHLDSVANQTERCSVKGHPVPLRNALNAEFSVLRAWMLPSALEALRTNKHNEYPQRLFAHGSVFARGETDTGILETGALVIVSSHTRADYTEARQFLQYISRLLDIEITVEESEFPWAISGRAATVRVGKNEIGILGEVHPQVLSQWELEMPVAVCELSLDALFESLKK